MEFFNKKEEVIDLQLTQYGKHLLSLGKLKPVYYAFYDDGIIYDSNYLSFNEPQYEAELRIQENTPNLKPFHNFHSIEDEMKKAIEAKNSGDSGLAQQLIEATPEKSQILIAPLAKSDLGNDKIPAWNITLLDGKMLPGSTTATLALSSSGVVLDIPQIEVQINYKVVVNELGGSTTQTYTAAVMNGEIDGIPQSLLEQQLAGFDDINYDVKTFEDGTSFNITTNDLIVQVIEENVPYANDNFDIEVYGIRDNELQQGTETTTVTEVLPLRFLTEPDLIIDDILYDEEEINRSPIPDIDSSFVDYYFDFEADDEIEASLICNKIKNGEYDLYRFARRDFECPDTKSNYQFLDPYAAKSADDQCGSE
jgi:hypothetical protein